MRRRQRVWTTAIGLVVLALAACGGPGPGEQEPAAGTRTVSHAMGTTEVPASPSRVVVLETGELDAVLALGITPVGATSAFADGTLPTYLAERTQDVEIVGTIAEPNLEAIAALQPDLILSNKLSHEDIYTDLSGIAATVFAESVGVAWKDTVRTVGEALGRPTDAERILADYLAKAQQTGQAFGDPAETSVSMVRFTSDQIRLYGEGSFIGTILSDAGFSRPPSQQIDETLMEVSREQLGLADADLLFYSSFGPEGAEAAASVFAGPLWRQLPVVAAGRAHQVSDDIWYLGIGPVAANLVLDELRQYAR